ncbi:hypothetical protein FRB93_005846 [Tulasnella sp. JGI-2019a]|nr:hypothetical protein FRB93_005846 [Tulasnella sp. JGI-2019a]
MLTIGSALGIALLVLLSIRWYRSVRSRRSIPYPPGPPGHFLFGNLRQMPSRSTHQWLTFTEWGRKYGPLTYLNIAGRPILVINTQEAAVDLLEKRAAIYSDRSRVVMAELSGWGEATAMLRLGPKHRLRRKLLAQALHPRLVQRDYVPMQERIARKFSQSLLDSPANYYNHIHRLMGETAQVIAYGECSDGDIDLVELGRENMRNTGKLLAGYAVDFFPWLAYLPDWFPGTQFKQDAKSMKAVMQKTRRLPFEMVKKKMASGTAPPSFVLTALEGQKDGLISDVDGEVISYAALTIYGGKYGSWRPQNDYIQ